LENLGECRDIYGAWESVRNNSKVSAKATVGHYEWKQQHKPRFDYECLEFVDQRKRAKLQWSQDQSQVNAHDLNSADMKLVDIPGTNGCNM
jgi:hypothetical protein